MSNWFYWSIDYAEEAAEYKSSKVSLDSKGKKLSLKEIWEY